MFAYNLPPQITPFIGRSDELSRIAALLNDPACRLLTLTGPGGIGKTRLALEAAQLQQGRFPDGVFLAPLQEVSSSDLMAPAIAHAIHFQFHETSDPEGQLLDYLSHQAALLVLDNFEHLTDGGALVSDILASAPNTKILVTSRERLNLFEEWVFEVTGLRRPHDERDPGAEQYSAVQMFMQGARRARPGFSLAAELPAVVRICSLVDGMPLALELASAWVRVLPLDDIVRELERGMDILQTPVRNIPARHRSMRVVMDQSWAMLSDSERDVFKKLSIFCGGFTREAAEAVGGATLPILSALVDKSWLRLRASTGRYEVHELLRQYGEQWLGVSPEADAVQDAHAAFFAALMARLEHDLKCCRQIEALEAITHDFCNVRSAWWWASERNDRTVLDAMAEPLSLYLDMTARFAEGEELFGCASECLNPDAPEARRTYYRLRTRRARMRNLSFRNRVEDHADMVMELGTAIQVAREASDHHEQAAAHFQLGILEADVDMNEAIPHFRTAEQLYAALDEPMYHADVSMWLTVNMPYTPERKAALERNLAVQREIGDLNGIGWTLLHLSMSALAAHDYAEMQRCLDEAARIQTERGDLKGLFYSKFMGMYAALRRGQFDVVRRLADEAQPVLAKLNLETARAAVRHTLGLALTLAETDLDQAELHVSDALEPPLPLDRTMIVSAIEGGVGQGLLRLYRGDLTSAQERYAALVDTLDNVPLYWDDSAFEALVTLAIPICARSGQPARAVEWLAAADAFSQTPGNAPLLYLDGAPFFRRLRAELEASLGAEGFAAAWARGSALDLRASLATLRALAGQREPSASPSNAADADALSAREMDILRLAADGLSNRAIADRLALALGTVKWYLNSIYGKLGVSSRTQAIARAREAGLLS